MNPFISTSLEWAARLLPTSGIINWTGQQLFLPLYHTVKHQNSLPHIHHLYPVRTLKQFEADLDFFLKYYTPISLSDLVERVQEERPLAKNEMHLSFDDGLREIYDFIAPVLLKKGIPATIFLNSGFIDNKDLFYRYKASLLVEKLESLEKKRSVVVSGFNQNQPISKKQILSVGYHEKHWLDQLALELEIDFEKFLKTQQPYLTSPQIVTLKNQGFTLGGHSVDHPPFGKISLKDQLDQTRESIRMVQSRFKESNKVFAFPFHDLEVSDQFFEAVRINEMADLTFGTAIFSKQKFSNRLQRFSMEGNLLAAKPLFTFKSLFFMFKSRKKRLA